MNIYYFSLLTAVIGVLVYTWFTVLKKYGGDS